MTAQGILGGIRDVSTHLLPGRQIWIKTHAREMKNVEVVLLDYDACS